MVVLEICVGSSCHVKGSAFVIEKLKELIKKHDAEDKIEFKASFCMDDCKNGVCLRVNGEKISNVSAANVEEIFEKNIMELKNK